MLILDTFGPAFGQPDASPFCVKSMCLLTVAGVSWKPRVGVDSRMAPFGKLPVLHDGEQLIPDSDNIRFHLEKICDIDFDVTLNAIERSQSRALVRMAEEHLYFCLVYDRWVVDENWQAIRSHFFADMPALLRRVVPALVRRKVLAGLFGQGIGRLEYAHMLARAEHDLVAFESALKAGPMLFGEQLTAADASVASVLAAIAGSPSPTGLSDRVRNSSTLVEYMKAVENVAYPAARRIV